MLPIAPFSVLLAATALASPVPHHYDQLDDPSLTYYWYNGTHSATVGEFIVKSGAQWHSLQTNRSGNVVTLHNKADYDALSEKPYTGMLAAPVDVDFDGLGVPYMEDFTSADDFKKAEDAPAGPGIHEKPQASCIIKFFRNGN